MIPPFPKAAIRKSIRALFLCALAGIFLSISCRSGSAGKNNEKVQDTQKLRQELIALRHEEKAIQQELEAARKSEPYLIIDFTARKMELKAKGRVLRAFRIKDVGKFLENIPADAQVLSKVEPIQKVVRPRIKPGEGETATAEAAQNTLWGLHRMPQDYDLHCESGLILEIRSLSSKESGSKPVIYMRNLYRKALNRFRQRKSSDGDQEPDAQLWLGEDDSRLLIWSLPKQLKIIIH